MTEKARPHHNKVKMTRKHNQYTTGQQKISNVSSGYRKSVRTTSTESNCLSCHTCTQSRDTNSACCSPIVRQSHQQPANQMAALHGNHYDHYLPSRALGNQVHSHNKGCSQITMHPVSHCLMSVSESHSAL